MSNGIATTSLRCQAARRTAAELQGRAQETERRLQQAQQRERELAQRQELLEDSVRLARLCVEEDQARVSYAESIISAGLQSVFGPRYAFKFVEIRDKNEALIGIRPQVYDGRVWVAPEFGAGEGVKDVCASLQWAAYLLLWKPALMPVWVADEPWVHLGPVMAERMVRFWWEMCEQVKLQSVVISHHIPAPPDVTVYEVLRDGDGISTVAKRQ